MAASEWKRLHFRLLTVRVFFGWCMMNTTQFHTNHLLHTFLRRRHMLWETVVNSKRRTQTMRSLFRIVLPKKNIELKFCTAIINSYIYPIFVHFCFKFQLFFCILFFWEKYKQHKASSKCGKFTWEYFIFIFIHI